MTIRLQDYPLNPSFGPWPQRSFYVGLLAGYGLFVYCLGSRIPVLLGGGLVIAAATIAERRTGRRQQLKPEASNQNLLHDDVFFHYVTEQIPALPMDHITVVKDQWRQTQTEIQAIHTLAVEIAAREPAFTPDLIETLHTVVQLAAQLSLSLSASSQVQVPKYQAIAQRQLQSSQNRLVETREQMRSLHDQLIIEGLTDTQPASIISNRLQTLITHNKNGLLQD